MLRLRLSNTRGVAASEIVSVTSSRGSIAPAASGFAVEPWRDGIDLAIPIQGDTHLSAVGGELSLDQLELSYSPTMGFYRAPVQAISNGGGLVIDDFGRQRCSPRDLLNRWIVPLESRVDFLTLDTGQKFDLPFCVMVVFATNVKPADLVDEAKRLMEAAKAKGGEIPVPVDVIVGKEFSESAAAATKKVDEVADDDMIFDVGPETASRYADMLKNAGTIVWNGPVGVFEFDQFGEGTKAMGLAIADSAAFSIAGGGDTLAAVDKYGIADRVSYISTGGGAFLEFLEGKKLPAVAILEERAKA